VSGEEKKHEKIQEQLTDERTSAVKKYQDLVVGKRGFGALMKYEFINWFCMRSTGAWGLLKRKKLYPKLLGSCGRGVVFGRNIVLRHPHKIHIGDNVVIDDNVMLDAKGTGNRGITIHDGAFIGRNTILSCKDGDIEIGEKTNIGFNCEIFSAGKVVLGGRIFLAAYCYLVGGTHKFDRTDIPIMEQERTAMGISVGDNCWLGAGVIVDDGVTIGHDAIVGAGAVVNRDVGDFAVVGGVPAKFLKDRRNS
jgi:acetyltransferase-like isoleucine patch superfamily enzyme